MSKLRMYSNACVPACGSSRLTDTFVLVDDPECNTPPSGSYSMRTLYTRTGGGGVFICGRVGEGF
uniref:Uncharacterized protein n=1 Tax=Gasterosteus aculeatus TaxID=69293 RepID=G3N9D6_GASAC